MLAVPASSDEEGEILPTNVTLYHITDESGTPVSFSILPIQWDEGDRLEEKGTNVYLHGLADQQKFYKRIIAWKFELSYMKPEVSVLSKDKNWITLHRPTKKFETTVRPILVTIHWLHSVKKDPRASPESIWNNLLKAFSSYDVKPIESDVSNHMLLLSEARKRDKDLASAKYFLAVMENPTASISENTRKAKVPKLILDNEEEDGYDYDDNEEDDEQIHSSFDPVCAICDNGGNVLCCEGRCLRSFHPTKADGIDTSCESLGYNDSSQVHAITNFFCNNCLYKRHQCYACGQLGSSDVSSTQEVFPCFAANCGRFYHPECVAKLLHADDKVREEKIRKGIAKRESFSCPLHKCFVCKIGEDRNVNELQFALCRRCPKAYHRKCLPRNIKFEADGLNQPRAWNSLLPNNRILIYCMDHPIIKELGTPFRDHLIFPNFDGTTERLTGWKLLGIQSAFSSSQSLNNNKPSTNIGRAVHKYKSNLKIGILSSSRDKEVGNSEYVLDAEEKNRLLALIEKAGSSALKNLPLQKSRNPVERMMPLGMVETHVNAVRTALSTLDNGGSKEDAEMFCDLESLNRLIDMKVQKGLKLRLGPFLHGNRYTSFGRHFTKLEKLKEIVNRLHWYVQNGDTCYIEILGRIVDFCCGSNDFSLLMKEKLEKTGKSCSFKNYDLFQPKNNFSFEKRDWMTVNVHELPNGSQLIMGLNPPFGVNASGANKFINKALKFTPKLIILIVPRETKRLDLNYPYDLIWEDDRIVSGKSFYLPGSIGVDNKQLEQWNTQAPPLYLWSRRDWTAKHSKVASEHGHIHGEQSETHKVESGPSRYCVKQTDICDDMYNNLALLGDSSNMLDDTPKIYEPFLGTASNDTNSVEKQYYFDGEENDMCLDMELESPAGSPNGCKNLGHHFEDILPGSV